MNFILNNKYKIFFVVLLMFFSFWQVLKPKIPSGNLNNETFEWLEEIRDNKIENTLQYFTEVHKKSKDVINDKVMMDYFYNSIQDSVKITADYIYNIDNHFVTNYGNFYDILFVKADGLIFNSIRRESDYLSNLFNGYFANSKLSQRLKEKLNTQFVEFEYYKPSDEFAAFFVIPIQKNKIFQGWIIFQLPLNNINTILSDHEKLGKTGEVYLVNQEKMMLSESRFIEDASMLRLVVDTKTLRSAIKNNHGNKIIEDYRGVKVYSSFRKFNLYGSDWIMIAEIDEDEVLSNHYLEYSDFYSEKFPSYLKNRVIIQTNYRTEADSMKRIDVGEFAKTKNGKPLYTKGVASCTSAAIFYKNRFGYLAHISPIDNIYFSKSAIELFTDFSLNFFYNHTKTNFLKEIAQNIAYSEVYPSELKNVEFVLTATHTQSLDGAIKSIISNGIGVSNIKFMYNPKAKIVNVSFNPNQNNVIAEWYLSNKTIFESSENIPTFGELIRLVAAD